MCCPLLPARPGEVVVVDGQPQGDDLHRLKGPVGAVLMPQNQLPILGRLANIVGGEEGDVVTEVLGGDIEKSLVGH